MEKDEKNVRPNSWMAWFLAARPKTLAAAVAPVMVGTAIAYASGGFRLVPAVACLLFAVLMQVAANLINDLYDYLKGSDGEDRLGPLRATAQGWISPSSMKKGIAVVVAMACLCGSTLIYYAGWEMILVGMGCVLFAYLYTSGPFPLAYNGLGDVAVVAFFGVVAVGFTAYVQMLEWTSLVTYGGIATGLVVNTLLTLNNYRDRETDARSGKRTLVVLLGEPFGRWFYLLLGAVAIAIAYFSPGENCVQLSETEFLVSLVIHNVFLGLYLGLHIATWREICRIREGRELNTQVGATSRNMLIFAFLYSLDLVYPCLLPFLRQFF